MCVYIYIYIGSVGSKVEAAQIEMRNRMHVTAHMPIVYSAFHILSLIARTNIDIIRLNYSSNNIIISIIILLIYIFCYVNPTIVK
jgi:cellulose synthase/poly-beta-1,6-N-acetylglucosamine synthase-like glycosyltransferase